MKLHRDLLVVSRTETLSPDGKKSGVIKVWNGRVLVMTKQWYGVEHLEQIKQTITMHAAKQRPALKLVA